MRTTERRQGRLRNPIAASMTRTRTACHPEKIAPSWGSASTSSPTRMIRLSTTPITSMGWPSSKDDCGLYDAFMKFHGRLYKIACVYRNGRMFDLRPLYISTTVQS